MFTVGLSVVDPQEFFLKLLDLPITISVIGHLSQSLDLLFKEMLSADATKNEALLQFLLPALALSLKGNPCLRFVVLGNLDLVSEAETFVAA